ALVSVTRLSSALVVGVALGWAAGCFVLNFYPALQVPMGYLCVLLFVAYLAQEPGRLARLRRWGLVAAPVALGILVLGLVSFLRESSTTVDLLRNTVYPGQRLSVWGDLPVSRLFLHDLLFGRQRTVNWSVLDNVCEAGGYIYLFPVMGLCL